MPAAAIAMAMQVVQDAADPFGAVAAARLRINRLGSPRRRVGFSRAPAIRAAGNPMPGLQSSWCPWNFRKGGKGSGKKIER